MTRDQLSKTLTEHFNRLEFFPNALYHKEITPEILRKVTFSLYRLACILEHVRAYYGSPITVTSGFRTILQNKLAGGVFKSDHLTGHAVDFTTANLYSVYEKIKNDQEYYLSCGVRQVIYYSKKCIIHIGISDTESSHIDFILK